MQTEVGLYISRNYPFIGASPDAIEGSDTVIEVKCPLVLEKLHPKDFESLSANQIRTVGLFKNDDGDICLSENHRYFYQVQWQMLVTGRKKCFFVV